MKVNEVSVNYEKNFLGTIKNSNDVVNYCRSIPEMDNRIEYQEVFLAVYLDNGHNIMCHQVISIGSLTATVVDLRIIFSTALKTLSTNIVVCHNHPSGKLVPSTADIKLNEMIKKAGELFSINLVDSLIITRNGHYSFADQGTL
jgi:DNA repair protein RadC